MKAISSQLQKVDVDLQWLDQVAACAKLEEQTPLVRTKRARLNSVTPLPAFASPPVKHS